MAKGSGAILVGGIATHIVAIACWYAAFRLFDADALKLWVNLILPFGALILGVVGGCGFWFAARAANRPATPGLKWAATAIAVVTVFVIRYLGYWTLEFEGTPIRTLVDFGTYMTETLGHARMNFSHGGQGLGSVDLGPLGYLMEALQTAAYALPSFAFVAKLPRAVRCEGCNRWMEETQTDTIQCNDQDRFRAMHQSLPAAPATRLAMFRATPSDSDGPYAGTLRFSYRLAECPGCDRGALTESAEVYNGKYFAPVSVLARVTPFDRSRAPPPPAPDVPPAAQPRTFGRRTSP